MLFKLKKNNFYLFLALFFVVLPVFATPSLGSVAGNITNFINGLGSFFYTLFFSISFGFFVGTLIKYKAHRDSPSHVTLSVPITLLFLALAFLGLGILLYYSPQNIFGPSLEGGGLGGTEQVN